MSKLSILGWTAIGLCLASMTATATAGIVRDAMGQAIGEYDGNDRGDIIMTTASGYLVYVDAFSGEISAPQGAGSGAYLDANCVGPPYALNLYLRPLVYLSYEPATNVKQIFAIGGEVVPVVLNAGDFYYQWGVVGPGSTPVCHGWQVEANEHIYLFPMIQNNPAETGVGNGPFHPPFRISMSSLFLDGFDGV